MIKNLSKLVIVLFLSLIAGCSFEEKNIKIDVLSSQKINFNSESIINSSDLLIRDNGRLIFRKLSIPEFNRKVSVEIFAELVSNGDPWDKSGSIFLLNTHPDSLNITSLELLRFITPFGVGHFSDNERLDEFKPVYIPRWEKSISWNEDISHLSNAFYDEVWIGVWIDTFSKDGWLMDVSLSFKESPFFMDKKSKAKIKVLANTHNYSTNHNGSFDFSREDLKINFSAPEDISNANLYFITTGHGAHSEGDEFNQRNNIIKVNNEIKLNYPAWRDDCASFRRFNPSSGVWFEETIFEGETIKERIASSDYSRSNWCPGSSVKPMKIHIGDLKKGSHVFSYQIPNAQPTTDKLWNHWNVSYYLTYEN